MRSLERPYWVLNGKLAVPATLLEWAKWFETGEGRRVARDRIGGIEVSTVFLGIDHQFGEGPPLLFETMIFRGGDGNEQWRCGSWEEAEAQHKKAVALVRREIIQKVNL